MLREKTARDVDGANSVACAIQNLPCVPGPSHQSHVMHADAVVIKRQRMQEHALSLACESVGKLCDDGLSRLAQLSAEHDDRVALRLGQSPAQGFQLFLLDAELGRRQLVLR